jgi:KDO2-lipid IV(A) lauroyltransferase
MRRKAKSKLKKQIELGFGLFALQISRAVFRLMSLKTAVRLGTGLGNLAYRIMRSRRKMALNNLQAAFPDWSKEQRETVARGVFINLGCSLAEFMKAPSIGKSRLADMFEIEGKQYFDEVMSGGKGILLITAHTGNWELAARYISICLGHPVKVVARNADDQGTTSLVNDIRNQSGYDVMARGNAAKQILKALKQNIVVGILPDQNAGDLYVPFFGMECGSVAGPAVLHIRTGAPLLPVFSVRLPNGRHRLEVKPPIVFDRTGDTDTDVKTIMTLIQAEIEAHIRRYPDQWLWIHDRWRSARKRSQESVSAN